MTLKDLFFPRRCPVCDRIAVPLGEKICTECIPKMRPQAAPWCVRCGRGLRETAKMSADGLCGECRDRDRGFTRGRSVFAYAGAAPSIYRFKYTGRREYAEYYAEETVRCLKGFLDACRADAIIPVPLHKKRLQKRGYNQAAEYARALSKLTGIPLREDVLFRVRNTLPMKYLGAPERQNNLKKAFIVPRNDVKLRRVLVVDDIYTTGATMEEISKALHESGTGDVFFVTVASGQGV